jgi:hypothetical protein
LEESIKKELEIKKLIDNIKKENELLNKKRK